MGLFNNKKVDKNKDKQTNKDFEAEVWKKQIDKYIESNHLKDMYTVENQEAMNRIAIASAAKGTIPQFEDNGIRTIYSQQLVLEAQNWMQIRQNDRLIKQNDEIIKLLKGNNK